MNRKGNWIVRGLLAAALVVGADARPPTDIKEALDCVLFVTTFTKDGKPAKLKLVKILNAEQQVVAGMNYRLKLSVQQGDEVKTAEALVWWQAWRKPDPYQLTSWTWK